MKIIWPDNQKYRHLYIASSFVALLYSVLRFGFIMQGFIMQRTKIRVCLGVFQPLLLSFFFRLLC